MKQNHNNPWKEWDYQLNEQGDWLLVGAIACASLPAFPGMLGLFIILGSAIQKSYSNLPKRLEEKSNLESKLKEGTITEQERKELNRLKKYFGSGKVKRVIKEFKLGFLTWIGYFIYQICKAYYELV